MIQKRSKMTIILDILPVKIHVLTAIAAENKASAYWSRQGQCRGGGGGGGGGGGNWAPPPPPPPRQKKYTPGNGREYPPSSRVPQPRFPGPAPHDRQR